jgi:exosortase/archaeosortase family protein
MTSAPGNRPALLSALVNRKGQLDFAAKFIALVAVWSFVYSFPYPKGSIAQAALTAHLELCARLAGGVLRLFDPLVHVSGQQIVGRYALQIVKDCDAMDVIILLVSAVVTFPSTWKNRLLGAVLGVAFVYALNLARICSLYFVGIHFPNQFELAHREIWPLLMVVATVAGFFFWISRLIKTPTPAASG